MFKKSVFKRIYFSTKTDDWKNVMINIVESKGNKLEGVLYEIDSNSMKIFDELEKLSEGKHSKIAAEIKMEDGNIVVTQIFISRRKDGDFKPSKKYIYIIVEGAKIHNLSLQYIEYLRSFAL